MSTLVKFGAPWCVPCRMMEPVLRQLAEDHPDLVIVDIDVDADPQAKEEWHIDGVPTLIRISDDGGEARHTGALPKRDLEHFLGIK